MKVVCEKCESSFKFEAVKDMECCPVCGEPFDLDCEHSDWITWYYYKDPVYGDCSLWDKLPLRPEELIFIKEFQAPPRDANGNCDAAKKELRKYVPDAFPEAQTVPKVQCPYCFSTEVQLVPKKFSILTGFATNSYNRVCVRCQRKF